MKIGEINELKLERITSIGHYLSDDLGVEVLLPKRYCIPDSKEGDVLKVFVYRDSEDRPIATTEQPLAKVHEFALLKVKSVEPFGVFLDWGLSKDLFVPMKEAAANMLPGQSYLVYVYLDDLTRRVVASCKLDKFLSTTPEGLDFGDEVSLLVWQAHELGWKVIVNDKFPGMLYQDQTFMNLSPGIRVKGFVNNVREDGKIDTMLQRPGYAHVDEAREKVLETLRANGGRLALSDGSSPEEITALLSMSKKTFKKAVGALYKARLIQIEDGAIRLI